MWRGLEVWQCEGVKASRTEEKSSVAVVDSPQESGRDRLGRMAKVRRAGLYGS